MDLALTIFTLAFVAAVAAFTENTRMAGPRNCAVRQPLLAATTPARRSHADSHWTRRPAIGRGPTLGTGCGAVLKATFGLGG